MSDHEYAALSDASSNFEDGEDEVDFDVSMDGSDFETTSKHKRGRKKKAKPKDYTITNALKAPRATTYTAQALFDQIVNGDIDLDPEYQRDVVWPEAKQVGLIDSVFRNFYIPPVIFSVNFAEDGSETRTCIDGKQRLTSIYRFMLGLIYHRDRVTNEKYWYKDSAAGDKKRRTILPEKYRRLFANKQIVCVEYGEIGDKDEREIFQRVQLGMALTPAEKLGVLKSPRADFIREIQSTFFKDDSSSLLSLAWERSRGTDFRCLATILWCIDRYNSSPDNMSHTGSISQIESFLSTPKQVLTPSFKAHFKKSFQTFEDMVASDDDAISGVFRMTGADFGSDKAATAGVKKKDKVSPVEFICISLLILIWRDKMSTFALAAAIKQMRREVRSEHIDLRMNTRVGGTMITFIKAIKPADFEAIGGKTKNLKSSKDSGTDDAKTGAKRKRVQDGDGNYMSDASMLDGTSTPRPIPKNSKTRPNTSASASASPAPTQTSGGLAALRRVTLDHQKQTS